MKARQPVVLGLLFCVLPVGCMGRVSDHGGGPREDESVPAADASGGAAGTSPSAAGGRSQTPPVPEVPGQPFDDGIAGNLRRLTIREYRNTIVDLLGTPEYLLYPTEGFAPDGRAWVFENNRNLPTSAAIAFDYLAAAEVFAEDSVTHRFESLSTCDFAKTEDACAKDFVVRVGQRALRRPLTDLDTTEFMALYKAARAAPEASYREATRVVLTAFLQSPEFLYHFEVGDEPRATTASKTPLTDYEVASRLSYAFWSSMPDSELFAAAARGELRTVEGITKQVNRILAMPHTRETLMNYFAQWLDFDHTMELYNNPAYGEVRPFIIPEIKAFIQSVVFDGDGQLATLLKAPYSFLNEPLAAIYGVDGLEGDTLKRTALDPNQRAGLLTMPVFLGNTSNPDGSIRPVIRGKYVRQRLLCQEMPPPPPEANTKAPEVKEGSTTRQRVEQHAADPFCAGCHRLMDPIGLIFDRYDSLGRYRPAGSDGTDDQGELVATDVNGKVNGVRQLAERLSMSKDVQACVASSWFRFALGRSGEDPSDEMPLRAFIDAFARSGDMRGLFRGLSTSDAFRFIQAPKGQCR